MKLLFIDFEFNRTSEAKMDVVSVAYTLSGTTDGGAVWLYDGKNVDGFRRRFREIIKDPNVCLVAYAAEAEARAFFSLGVDVRGVKCIDLYLEYRNLLNHNHALSYGKQYVDGKVIYTTPPPPKWERTDDDDEAHHKPSYSLAAATYKLLGQRIDTAEKDELRRLIISADREAIEARRDDILRYNEKDIQHLPRLLSAMVETDAYYRYGCKGKPSPKVVDEWKRRALLRGEYAIATAVMVSRGYPIDAAKLSKFEANVDKIMLSAAREVNVEAAVTTLDASSIPFIPMKWNRKKDGYSLNERAITGWIKAQNFPYWRKTKGGEFSLSKDAFSDWFDSTSPGFPGAFCRYLKTKQSLNGFLPRAPGSDKEVFRDFLGSDGRARPYMGIFGSQSSRSQPGAKGFIPLKAHWMRNFIHPAPGAALCSVDYSSQEFLIAACLSQDDDMLAAYASGDVYTAFGIAAGIMPKGASKKTHPLEREGCKATVLGISYDMTERGLAPRLSRALGRDVSDEEAKSYIELFYETYPTYAEWKLEIQRQYESDKYLELADGWTMWGDNDNRRSVGNFPVQGTGAVIMRRAVKLAESYGVRVLYTLHDSLTAEYRSDDFDKIRLLKKAMSEAFSEVVSTFGEFVPIRLEGEAWSSDYTDVVPAKIEGIKFMTEYSDAKGEKDLEKYRKFFT